MPKIVDHDAQRTKFAEAAMRLIANHGLEGVTMRSVAKEAGLSYGSLFHYFDSKDELLLNAIGQLMQSQTARFDEFVGQHSGLDALEQLLCDDAIIDKSSRDSWLVWLTFLYKAALQEAFADMHADLINGWLARISGLLKEAIDAGELRPDFDIRLEALALWTYSAGVGQMGLLDPKLLPPRLQKKLISNYIDKLRLKSDP